VKRFVPLTLVLLVLPSLALASNPKDEIRRLNRADIALAKQAAVRKTDLVAGWRLTHSGPPPKTSDEPCTSADPDLSAFVITGEHETDFTHGATSAELDSDVQVFRNVSDASRDFKASATRGLLTCLKTAFAKSLRQSHVPGKVTSAGMGRTPRIGAQAVFYRIVATISPTNGLPRFRMYADFIAIRKGRSQASLMFISPLARVQGQLGLMRAVARRMR